MVFTPLFPSLLQAPLDSALRETAAMLAVHLDGRILAEAMRGLWDAQARTR